MKTYKINYIVYKDLFDHKEIIEDVKGVEIEGKNLANVEEKIKEEVHEKYGNEVTVDIYFFENLTKIRRLNKRIGS